MFIRFVNGRPYLAESERTRGKVVQRHLGPASPDVVRLIKSIRGSQSPKFRGSQTPTFRAHRHPHFESGG